MTWGMVAVAGASLVVGGMAAGSADDATDASSEASEASLAFEREKYADWQATYGGVEENLSQYYNNLTSDYYEAQGLEAFQQEHQLALKDVRSTLAQRGIADSGIAGIAELDFANEGAKGRAQIRAAAPGVAADEKLRFLQVGLGLNPGESMSRTLSQNAQNLSANAREANMAAGEAVGSAITTAGTALGDYLDNRSTNTVTGDS